MKWSRERVEEHLQALPFRYASFKEEDHPRNDKGRFTELSDMDISYHDLEKAVLRVADDPVKASDTDIRRSLGRFSHLREHVKSRLEKGEITKEQADDILDSYDRETDWYKSILRDREAGRK